MFLQQGLVLIQTISESLYFDALLPFARRLGGIEDTIRVMLRACAAWPLSVALDFPFSASDAGECGPSRSVDRR